ncbi:hypothetical protein A5707_11350 [Mycobacterium kyorinense]|uniref:Uncharacterized protein n=1 Tax=Mycobacterium kyorinense TaxID=487514 RepID=A0A1A2ZWL0_9MYCO|nr:hypothetical protein [Mycobacterium kyorinense]OBI53461.1 hypothetical protein A5707_11350 [Mycobacterium kyorinense]
MIKGAALDTRLQHGLLLDPKLQRRLSGEEFRSFVNVLVWVVSLVTDGWFNPDDAEMIIADRQHIDALAEVGLVERCEDSGLYRVHPDYWAWQTSKAQLEGLAARREADKLRKRKERDNGHELQAQAPFS